MTLGKIFYRSARNCAVMTCRIFPADTSRFFLQQSAFVLVVVLLIISAGCSSVSPGEKAGTITNITPSPAQSVASYIVAINQPDARSGYVKMDTDVYNIGEVVEFTVTNDGSGSLDCAGNPPGFFVKTQSPIGAWITKMGDDKPDPSAKSSLSAGGSTRRYAFVTTGWEPGRYRIVHDCGVEREFLLKSLSAPVVTMTPEACPVSNASDRAPWIVIDEIQDPVAYQPFTIRGTTNIPAGQDLVYTIFEIQNGNESISLDDQGSFRTTVVEGSCGTNTWEANGEIQATGEFAIGIMGTNKTPSAIRRFNVLPE